MQVHDKRSNEEIAILEIQRLIKSQMALKEEARAFLPEDQLELVGLYEEKLILSPEEKDYLNACRAEVARVKREKLRRRRNIIIMTILAFLALSALTIYAFNAQSEARQAQLEAEEALATIERNQKIKVAEELKIHGESYLELGKDTAAKETFKAALDSLGTGNKDLKLYQELEQEIKDLE